MTTDLFEVMRTCRAMRRYEPRDVPQETIDELIDLAIRAPSAGNTQNWTFVVVRDPAVKHALAEEVRKGTRWEASLSELAITHRVREGMIDEEEEGRARRVLAAFRRLAEEFDDVPVVVCVCAERGGGAVAGPGPLRVLRGAIDTYGVWGTLRFALAGKGFVAQGSWASVYPAVQNLLLAARGMGLGAVLTTPQLLGPPGRFEKVLDIPKGVRLAALIPIGYPKGKFGPVRRLPATVFKDRYGRS
jgi:nitroreductase